MSTSGRSRSTAGSTARPPASSARKSCAAGSATTTPPSSSPDRAADHPRRARHGLARDAATTLALAALGALAALAGARFAPASLLNLGPNDAPYLRGFRGEWERDGRTRFHWTGPQAAVTFPVRAAGEGFVLLMRVRRHFLDPARVRLLVEGAPIAAFPIQADPRVAYRTVEIALPPLTGRHPFVLGIEAPSDNPRPLGIAVDWVELQRARGGRFALLPRAWLALATAIAAAFLAPRAAGAPRALAAALAAALALAAGVGAWRDPIALDRIVREGAGPFAAVALLAALLCRSRIAARALRLDSDPVAGGLVGLTLLALAVRLALLLHPQFFYPDVRVHGLFVWELARRGLQIFLEQFTVNQYRYSLGLQFENGHWYAFPYPPAFYVLAAPLARLARYTPEAAASVTAAVFNALETLVVFAIARRLGRSAAEALAAAAAVIVLPLFIVRLTLAYFPALVGHAIDAVVILVVIAHLGRLSDRRVVAIVGLLVALALLTYTQSVMNFAIVLGLFLVFDAFRDRSREGRRRQMGLVATGLLGALLAAALFYGRYVPVLVQIQRGEAPADEHVVLERLARTRPDPDAPPEEIDPYTGPHVDPVRGLRKAGWRLWVFYSAFAPLAIAGALIVLRDTFGPTARFVAAWALTYLVLNLASGGLPGPNLVRYNKDLEVVAPLACIGLAAFGAWLWRRARALAIAYGGTWFAYGAWRAARALTDTFVLER